MRGKPLTFPWSRWKALVLDDPLQHNDSIHAAAFADLMANLISAEGYQILLSTHDACSRWNSCSVNSDPRRIPCATLSLLGIGKEGVGVVGAVLFTYGPSDSVSLMWPRSRQL